MFCQLYLHIAVSSPFFVTSCCKLGFLCLYMRMVVNHVCVASRLLDGIVYKSTGLMCGAMPSLTHTPLWCAQGQLYCCIYQTVETLLQYIRTCYFCDLFSLHSLWTWSVCFLFITVHCHFKNNVCFLTVHGLVRHGTVLPSISVTHLH
jgi:hypothetical protein